VKEKRQRIAPVNLVQVLPPSVAITAPNAGTLLKTERDKIELKAAADSVGNHPVTSMRLLMDGRPYDGQRGVRAIDNPRLGRVEANWTVEVPPGRHSLRVQAESAVSKGLSEPLEVLRTSATPPELPNLYILAVGINAYKGRMRLQFAATDAQAISQAFKLRSKNVFKNVEVHLVTDREATRANMLEGLKWLGSKMTARDVGIFFFSGHGATDDDGNFFLVPVNVSPLNLEGTCVSGEVLKKNLANMPGRIVAMLDCCHSGSVADNLRASRPDNLARDLVTDDYGVVVMCSSLGSEVSIESPETRAGFFTTGLVEGLSGKADFNHDHTIHIHELDFYAARRVKQLSRGTQNPVTGRPPTIRSFPLGKF
jgi:hypothetical protein